MNAVQTLLLIWAAGGALSRDGNRLNVRAPKGAIPSQLVDALRENKAELLAILPARSAVLAPPEDGV